MKKLPVIVGMGGMNAAGRSSGAHSYKRMVADALSHDVMQSTWQDLGRRMGLDITGEATAEQIETIKAGTLVRKLERFDPQAVRVHQKANVVDPSVALEVKRSKSQTERFSVSPDQEILLPEKIALPVSSAGGLPSGFDPAALYKSHHHPRGLQLSIYGVSDALNSMGIAWDDVLKHIKPDEVAVYAGSALAQVDSCSLGGIFAQPLLGGRVNSKMMALSLSEMPADFINSYVINSVGLTGHNVGACATFLYNLKQGIESIQSGQAKIAIVGGVEAPLVPEVVEGFRVMSALITDKELAELDGSDTPNHRRACRPFSTNAGFTLAEASQFVILMDDELALQLGAHVYGGVADVFIHADANKKSISGPGIGNYITMAKAAALANAMFGGLEHTFVQAHATSTPQNRVTESHILNSVAQTFKAKAWPVAAVKAYVGHTVSAAAGDQLITSLGVWQHGWVPGIQTIDHFADDVHRSHLNILTEHLDAGKKGCHMKAAILNSKGFGGNNASAVILSPEQTESILKKRHGAKKYAVYQAKNTAVERDIAALDARAVAGEERIVYQFGEAVMDADSVSMTPSAVKLSGFDTPIDLPTENPFD